MSGFAELAKPEIKPESQVDRELARLLREVDRTRTEYQDAHGEEREQCWKLYQRAMINYNAALARITGSAANRMEVGMDNRQTQGGNAQGNTQGNMGSSTTKDFYEDPNATKTGGFVNQQETPEKIVDRFKISVKGDPTGNLHQLSLATTDFAKQILALTPIGRERSVALTNLEQCWFWLNAATTRGTGPIAVSNR